MRKAALIVITLIICIAGLYAGTTGKLAGRVRGETGKGIAFVNVLVMQDGRRVTGILTRENGTYMIINIPAGEYEVRFQLQGYALVVVPNVRINVNATTTQNATMTKKGIVLDKIVVAASAPAVDKSITGSTRTIEVENLGDMAITDVQDIVALQAGAMVVGGQLHIRGGRANEVNFTIDNMSVSDPVDGGAALQVDPDAISDMKVMTGGFTAEYGNAQSGVVNIVTKDGDPFYSGKVEYSTDRYIGESRNEDTFRFAIGGPVVPFSNEALKNRFTFFFNGGGNWSDGRLRKYAKGDPNESFVLNGVGLLENDYPEVNPFRNRESIFDGDNWLDGLLPDIDIGNRFYNSYNANFKTKYAFNELQKITFAARGDRNINDFFSHLWRYAPDFNGMETTNQRQFVATYDHVLSPTMNFQVKGSYFQKDYEQGPKNIDRDRYFFPNIDLDSGNLPPDYVQNVLAGDYGYDSVGIDSDGDGNYFYHEGFLDETEWQYRIQGVEDPRTVPLFAPPGTIFEQFINDRSSQTTVKADFEWQVNDIHKLKSGVEIIKHHIKKDQIFNFLTVYADRWKSHLESIYDMDNYVDPDPTDGLVYVPEELVDVVIPDDGSDPIGIYKPEDYLNAAFAASGKRDGYKANPWQASYYLQDKMEWEGMIVNAGLRFDFWYLGESYYVLLDDGTFEERPRRTVVKYNSAGAPIDTTTVIGFDENDRFQLMLSPRLGVSHPISDRNVLRFAYNYQNQLPQMQFIFTSKTSEDANVSEQNIVVGNPALQPQITVTYEVGLSHQLSEDYVVDMTAYYKNLYNYVSTRKVEKPDEPQVFWYEYISEDYGSARGIDLQLEKSLSDFNTWSVAYSLAWAHGNNSATVIQDETTNLREFPLDWDVRHNVNVNYTFRIARGEEYIVPFTNFILPLDDFSANFTWTLASGAPYTPTSGFQNIPLDTNSRRKGLTQNANLRLTKGFELPFGSMRAYMDVENLFKFPNISTVFPRTGSAYDTGIDLSEGEHNYTFDEVRYMHNKAFINPGNTNDFRAVTIGVSVNF